MRWVFAAAAAAALVAASGCATRGPGYIGPTSGVYAPETGDVAMPAAWYPNTLLDGALSFHNDSNDGALVLRGRRLLFTIEEPSGKRQLIAWQASADAVTYITAKQHGVSRILRLQAGGAPQSFTFAGSASDGTGKDGFVDRILALFHRS